MIETNPGYSGTKSRKETNPGYEAYYTNKKSGKKEARGTCDKQFKLLKKVKKRFHI